ncbi:hypothetical protein MHBO_002759 [Bonamia ostreae]|uniref:Kinesin motor domain-containing protein n=1 Tax=Bonamia ostreae TaxID=126728 RepID=A0ABV2ANF3_9EUKA
MQFERLKSKSLKLQNNEKEITINQIEKRISLSSTVKKFNFDRVYDEFTEQEYLFEKTVTPIIREVIEGFNCTIFAYGQTGTGKTFTIEGEIDYNLALNCNFFKFSE